MCSCSRSGTAFCWQREMLGHLDCIMLMIYMQVEMLHMIWHTY